MKPERDFASLVREIKRRSRSCYQGNSEAARALEAQARWIGDGVVVPPGGYDRRFWENALREAASQLRDEA